MTTSSKVLDKQVKAWKFYGVPYEIGRFIGCEPVGEVRYVVGWAADQMARMRWNVLVDGSTEWTITLPNGETVRTSESDDTDTLNEASSKVLAIINWTRGTVRQSTTNLYVAGEFDFTAVTDDEWRVVSVIDPQRNDIRKTAVHSFTALWPHPADPSKPDAPLFGVLPILDELDWLAKLSRSQSKNRVGMRGIVGIADGMSGPNNEEFWPAFEKIIDSNMQDPDNVAPAHVRGALELVEPISDHGMRGLSWLIPDFPYDDRLADKVTALIQRLAYGLPIPPEILLGLQAQSRATAFQVEENSYRAHIEPPANLVAAVATEALQLLIPDQEIEVVPDPTDLLTRRNSVQDVLEAWDRGLVTLDYVLEVLGIPDTERSTEADLLLIDRVRARTTARTDPANEAAAEGGLAAVTASVGAASSEPLTDNELSELAQQLAEVDHSLMMEMAGATEQAVDRARERIGARARRFEGLRDAVPADVPNDQVAAHIGADVLADSGVPVTELVAAALEPLSRWWTRRARNAQQTVQALLGRDAPAKFSANEITLSADLLVDLTAAHVLATLDREEGSELPAADRAKILDALGGNGAL